MTSMETIRVRVTPEMKRALQDHYGEQGQTLSEGVRQLFTKELSRSSAATARLDAIFASAQTKIEAAGMPEPSDTDIDELIAQVRSERMASGLARA